MASIDVEAVNPVVKNITALTKDMQDDGAEPVSFLANSANWTGEEQEQYYTKEDAKYIRGFWIGAEYLLLNASTREYFGDALAEAYKRLKEPIRLVILATYLRMPASEYYPAFNAAKAVADARFFEQTGKKFDGSKANVDEWDLYHSFDESHKLSNRYSGIGIDLEGGITVAIIRRFLEYLCAKGLIPQTSLAEIHEQLKRSNGWHTLSAGFRELRTHLSERTGQIEFADRVLGIAYCIRSPSTTATAVLEVVAEGLATLPTQAQDKDLKPTGATECYPLFARLYAEIIQSNDGLLTAFLTRGKQSPGPTKTWDTLARIHGTNGSGLDAKIAGADWTKSAFKSWYKRGENAKCFNKLVAEQLAIP